MEVQYSYGYTHTHTRTYNPEGEGVQRALTKQEAVQRERERFLPTVRSNYYLKI